MTTLRINKTKTVTAKNITGIKSFLEAWNGIIDSFTLTLNNGSQFGSKHPVNSGAILHESIEQL